VGFLELQQVGFVQEGHFSWGMMGEPGLTGMILPLKLEPLHCWGEFEQKGKG